MKLSRVEASSMHEALTKIRATLGEDAQIVGTRTFRKGGVLGVCSQQMVEVYVADTRGEKKVPLTGTDTLAAKREKIAALAKGRIGNSESSSPTQVAELAKMLGSLRAEIQELATQQNKDGLDHPFLRESFELLTSFDVDPGLAEKIVWDLKQKPLPIESSDPQRVRTVLRGQLRKLFLPRVPTAVPQENKVVVLIGPTGVGKTTTVAKLAARAKINDRKNVGLVTLDTFRIAAVDQLSKYAKIIGVPLDVVSDPFELKSSVKRFIDEGADVVLVDTAGRGQRDELKMGELNEFLAVVPDAEIHLVLSTTTHPRTLRNITKRFSDVGYHRLILTKLDETESFGALVSILSEVEKPVSFLTDGQNVPDDIMLSDPDRLSELVFRAGPN